MGVDTLVTIGADLSKMRRELAKLPNMTEKSAQKAMVAFEKQVARAEKAAKRAAKAGRGAHKDSAKGLETVEEAAGDADSAIMGLAGGLGLVNPKLAEGAGVAGDFGAGIESAIRLIKAGNPVLIGMAAAAAAAGAAYAVWADKQEKHRRLVEVSTAILALHRDMVVDLRSAQAGYLVTLGQLTEEERELMDVRRQSFTSTLPALKDITEQITLQGTKSQDLRRQFEAATAQLDRMRGGSLEGSLDFQALQRRVVALAESLSDAIVKEQALDAQRAGILSLSKQTLDVRLADVEATHKQQAAEARLVTIRETSAELEARRAAAAASVAAATEQAAQLIRAAEAGHMSRIDKINLLYDDRLAKIATLQEQGISNGQAEEARDAASRARLLSLGELHDQIEARKQAMRDAAIAAEEREHAERMRRLQQELGAFGTFFGGVSDFATVAADQRAEADAAASLRAFEIYKAAAITEATINAAVAATAAFKLGPIAGPIAAAGVALATGAQIATISAQQPPSFDVGGVVGSPSFDTGGVVGGARGAVWARRRGVETFESRVLKKLNTIMGMQKNGGSFDVGGMVSRAPDQVQASLLPGEAVLNRSAVSRRGRESIERENRGEGLGPAVVALPVYRHFGRFVTDEARRGGALTRALNRSPRTGRRGY